MPAGGCPPAPGTPTHTRNPRTFHARNEPEKAQATAAAWLGCSPLFRPRSSTATSFEMPGCSIVTP